MCISSFKLDTQECIVIRFKSNNMIKQLAFNSAMHDLLDVCDVHTCSYVKQGHPASARTIHIELVMTSKHDAKHVSVAIRSLETDPASNGAVLCTSVLIRICSDTASSPCAQQILHHIVPDIRQGLQIMQRS